MHVQDNVLVMKCPLLTAAMLKTNCDLYHIFYLHFTHFHVFFMFLVVPQLYAGQRSFIYVLQQIAEQAVLWVCYHM